MRIPALIMIAALCAAGSAQGAQKPRRGGAPPRPEKVSPPPESAPVPAPIEVARAPESPPWYRRGPAITLGLGFHLDDGTMRGTDRRSILVTDETYEFSNDSKLFASLGLLAQVGERLRVGGVARYFGSYGIKPRMTTGAQAPKRKLGTLFEVAAQGEYVLPLVPRWDLTAGVQGGLAVLVPGGQFEEEIRTLQNQGASVWDVPRLGYFLGPRVGVRWALADRVFLRGDIDVTWCQTFLYLTHDDVAGVDFEKKRRANVIREVLSLALEVSF
jgi:hypothetical protein